MKDKVKSRKLNPFTWNKENAKTKNYDWFKMVVNGLVENGQLDKPTERELRYAWKEITGEIITNKKGKK